jgi:hypothetical protein
MKTALPCIEIANVLFEVSRQTFSGDLREDRYRLRESGEKR